MMRTLSHYLLCLLFLLGGSTRLLAQVRPQGSNQAFTAVESSAVGVVAISSDGEIFHSTDEGSTYTELYSTTSPDELFGVGSSAQIVIASGTAGSLLRSDFSVDNTVWTETNLTSIIGDLRDVSSNGASVWLSVGDEVLRSIDNGLSWANVSPSGLDALQAVLFTGTASNWVAVGGSFDAEAYYSTDGGATWTASTLPASQNPLHALAVDSAGNLLAVGEGGTALLSMDQGQTFSALASVDLSQDLNGVVSTGADEWIVGGTERVLFSYNSDTDTVDPILEPSESGLDTGNDIALVNGSVIMAGVEEVAAPQINASETMSLEPIEVTLVPGAGTDMTYYTIDSTSPSDTKTAYTTAFTIDETLTVAAVSQLNGVYSAVVTEDFVITIHTLNIIPDGLDIDLTLDTSLIEYEYQLQSTTDLTNSGGWIPSAALTPGTGNPLDWNFINPASPLFWRVLITPL